MKIDKDNKYYYEISCNREGDIIDNINVECPNGNISISYYIGGIEYKTKEFLIFLGTYHEFKIRITFLEEPTIYTNINIHSRIYLISLKTKIKIQNQIFITDTNIYKDGMCGSLNDYTIKGGCLDDYKAYIK